MKESLKRAIRLDRNYWFRACTEPDLMAGHGVVRETVRIALEELRQEASQEASEAIASAQARIAELNRLIQRVTDLNLPASSGVWHKEQAEKSLDEARQLKAQETYFELLDAKAKAEEAQQICEQGITSLSEEAHNAVDKREKELKAELLARRQEYETELKALEDSTSQALLQAERSSQTELSKQKYALESEKRRLLDEAKKKEDYWRDLGNENTLGCVFGFIGFVVGIIIANITSSPLAGVLTSSAIILGPFIFFKVMKESAKAEQNRIEREYNDRIAALERKCSEELNLRRQQIIQQAEEERQALKERFERQCAELERLMDQEVIQKRHLLAQLFKT
jgi:gas vesicle protein